MPLAHVQAPGRRLVWLQQGIRPSTRSAVLAAPTLLNASYICRRELSSETSDAHCWWRQRSRPPESMLAYDERWCCVQGN